MDFQSFRVVLKAKTCHRVQDVLPAYCLPLLELAFLCSLRRDERDEFGDTFLHTFLSIFRDFSCRRHRRLHYARNVRYLEDDKV